MEKISEELNTDTVCVHDAAEENANKSVSSELDDSEILKKFQSKSDYIHRRIADSDVLISVGGNIANFNGYIELNASAAFLWDEMKEPRTATDLEKSLEKHFDVSHEQAVEDVLYFLKELQENDMVNVS